MYQHFGTPEYCKWYPRVPCPVLKHWTNSTKQTSKI